MSIRASSTPVLLGVRGGSVRGNAGVGVAGQGGSALSPLSQSSLTGWYDFNDISTLFQDTARSTPVTADGQLIGSVTDKSGGGRHLTRGGAGGTEPTYKAAIQNGNGIARFAGAQWLLSGATFTADTQGTLIMVIKNPGGSTLYGMWARSSTTNNRWAGSIDNGANNITTPTGTGAAFYEEIWNAPPTGFVAIAAVVNNSGPVSKLFGNGALQSSNVGVPNILTDVAFAIGSRASAALVSALVSDVGEVQVYNQSLSDTVVLGLLAGVKTKWGTP